MGSRYLTNRKSYFGHITPMQNRKNTVTWKAGSSSEYLPNWITIPERLTAIEEIRQFSRPRY